MKSFHISAVTPTIVIAMLGLITILILGIVIIILKPVNFEASILSFLYYLVILAIFVRSKMMTKKWFQKILKPFFIISFYFSSDFLLRRFP